MAPTPFSLYACGRIDAREHQMAQRTKRGRKGLTAHRIWEFSVSCVVGAVGHVSGSLVASGIAFESLVQRASIAIGLAAPAPVNAAVALDRNAAVSMPSASAIWITGIAFMIVFFAIEWRFGIVSGVLERIGRALKNAIVARSPG
jgi:hypothetical protein